MTCAIASVSWGKDSLAMLHGLIEREMPLDEVVFFDTGMEFPAIYNERDSMLPTLKERGIRYVEMHPAIPFYESMFVRPVKSRKTGEIHKHGYGWCGGPCRWGTTEKQRLLDRYAEAIDAIVYVGIAADEAKRLAKEVKPYKLHPLADWGMTEADCLAKCYGGARMDARRRASLRRSRQSFLLVLSKQEPTRTQSDSRQPSRLLAEASRSRIEARSDEIEAA